MGKKKFSNLEDNIIDIIENAIDTMDFYEVNKYIENTVGNAVSEVRNALGANRGQKQPEKDSYKKKHTKSRASSSQYHSQHSNFTSTSKSTPKYTVQKEQIKSFYPSVPIGRVSGILLTVFGWIFLPITGISALVLTLIGFLTNRMYFFGAIVLSILPFLLISFFMTIGGSRIRARLRRFQRYIGLFKTNCYYSIKDLAAQTQRSTKFITKDLRKMIALGMFPEGHIDQQSTCLILNEESYQQYLQLQKNLQEQKTETLKNTTSTPKDSTIQEETVLDKELNQAIKNGRLCISQIREANKSISGKEISVKLEHLALIVDKIFTHVEMHPNQLSEIEKFMDYYLPTTLKLVTAYKEFELQPVQGDNIRSAKQDIESTLDTINHAFEILLDSLFEDAAMDIATDISVLETMLAQEGLTKNKLKPM